MKRLLRIALLLSCFGFTTTHAAGTADAIDVAAPQVRAVPPGAKATAAFMTLKNSSAGDASLVKVESKAAKTVELHNHIDEGGVMKMRQVAAIAIKAKGETALQPGGYHVMLIDPTAPLKDGDVVGMTLVFADGSRKTIDAPVRKPEATPAANQEHHGHKH